MRRYLPVIVFALTIASLAAAQTPPPSPTPGPGREGPAGLFSGSVQVTNVTVLVRAVDRDGSPVTDLAPGDIKVLEDGHPAEVTGLEPFVPASRRRSAARAAATPSAAAPPAPVPAPAPAAPAVTIYVQADLLSRGQLYWALAGLRAEVARLLALGPAEVVVADPDPRTVAGRVTTVEELQRVLDRVEERLPAHSSIARLRTRFRREMRSAPGTVVRHLAIATYSEETALVSDSIDRIRFWGTAGGRRAGRVLILVSGGFDLDPWNDYYKRFADYIDQPFDRTVDSGRPGRNVAGGHEVELARTWDTATRELAGSGWTVIAFTAGIGEMDASVNAETGGHEAFSSFVDADTGQPQGVGISSGTMLLHPREPLAQAAEVSGGAVAASPAQLTETIGELEAAYVLSYTVARPPDSRSHELAVTTGRPGVTVRAPTVVHTSEHHGSDRLRAQALLAGGGERGPVVVTAELADVTGSRRKGYSGRLIVTARLGDVLPMLLASGNPKMGVTVAVDAGADRPFVSEGAPMPLRLADRAGTWIYEAPMEWPGKAKALAVVVGETNTDSWGGTVVELK